MPGNGISILRPSAPFATSSPLASRPNANFYTLTMRRAFVEILPAVQTEISGYDGEYPGPVILGRMGTPDVVRQVNGLDVETSVHQHGGHNASGSDITGPNVYQGLAAFYPTTDDLETGLVTRTALAPAVLPSRDGDVVLDVPLVLQDRRFDGRDEIVATRTFEFSRDQGAWQVNGRFYDEARADAAPRLGAAERWFLKNGGGGWWHPIHIHLEAHQVQSFNGRPPPLHNSFKKDTALLGPGDVAEVFLRFRDYTGRFVSHCHNLEHEDDRMMFRFDVVAP